MPRSTDEAVEKRLYDAYWNVSHHSFQLAETMKAPGAVKAYRAWLIDIPSHVPGKPLPIKRDSIQLSELIGDAGRDKMIQHYTMTQGPVGTAANYSSRVAGMTQVDAAVMEQAMALNAAKAELKDADCAIPKGSRRRVRLRLLPREHHMTYLLRQVAHTDHPLERLYFLWETKMFSLKTLTRARVQQIIEQSRLVDFPPDQVEAIRAIELQKLSRVGTDMRIVQRQPTAPSIVANAKDVEGGYTHLRLSTPLMTTCELPEIVGPGSYSIHQPNKRDPRSDTAHYTPLIEKLDLYLTEKKRAAV